MKKAWIENGAVRDLVAGDPAELFHSDIAALYSVDVPDDTQPGATQDDAGNWINRAAPAELEPAAPVPPKLSPVEFKLLFTAGERVAIKKSTDEIVQDFFSIVEDPRLTHVDMGLQSTKEAIAYLRAIGLLTAERAEAILTGQVV